MLILLAACSLDSEIVELGPEPLDVDQPEGMSGAPSSSTLMIVGADPADPRLVKVDTTGAVVLDFALNTLFDDWDTRDQKPNPMEVEPTSDHTYLVSFHEGGLVEFDESGAILWRLDDEEASHDVDRLDNGNTLYARSWVEQGDDVVREVDPQGNIVWSWTGARAFEPAFDGYADEGGAWMHVNAVQRLESGETSICVRNFNAVLLVGQDGTVSRRISFESPERSEGPQTTGKLLGMHPHAAEWGPEGFTVALRAPERVVTMRGGVKQRELRDTSIVGITDFDVLPNGNALVAAHGMVRETTAAGAVVWEWNQIDNSLDDGSDRARHVFNTIVPLGADGLAIDLD